MKFIKKIMLICLAFKIETSWSSIPKTSPSAISTNPSQKEETNSNSIPFLVSEQLRTGNLSCPKNDLITYEACLIYQGALGLWQGAGKGNNCPKPNKFQPNIIPDDALNAIHSPCFGYFYAIQVANITPALVSTATNVFFKLQNKGEQPESDANMCLNVRHGICGNHAAVAKALFEKAGFKARNVEFYYKDKKQRLNHIVTEVLIDGEWRLIDPTYGGYWLNKNKKFFELSSTEKIKKNKDVFLIYNKAAIPYIYYSKIKNFNFFGYLNARADIIRGGSGSIKISLKKSSGKELFKDIPNYLGYSTPEQKQGLVFEFQNSSLKHCRFVVNTSGSAIAGDQPADICIDSTCKKYIKNVISYPFETSNPKKMYIKSDADVAYVVMKSIEWTCGM